MQVYEVSARLIPSLPMVNPGATRVSFNVAVDAGALPASMAYTYTLDAGDGSVPGPCATLGTTPATSGAVRMPVPGVSVAYTSLGIKVVVLRMYEASACPDGTSPPASAPLVAAAIASVQVCGRRPLPRPLDSHASAHSSTHGCVLCAVGATVCVAWPVQAYVWDTGVGLPSLAFGYGSVCQAC